MSPNRTTQDLLRAALVLCALLCACRAPATQAPEPVPTPHRNALAHAPPVDVELVEPVELDGWTAARVMQLRRERVAEHPELLAGSYEPSKTVFGQVRNGLPWWGMVGLYCRGPGARAADGPSEETRFLANPFLLLEVDEGLSFTHEGPVCFPAWPRPRSLSYGGATAEVTYDISRLRREREELGLPQPGVLQLQGMNARDMGFVAVSVLSSGNVRAAEGSLLFEAPVELQGFLHPGPSCGIPGRCNNGSPRQPNLHFLVEQLPARLQLALHREAPPEDGTAPDFRYTLYFE